MDGLDLFYAKVNYVRIGFCIGKKSKLCIFSDFFSRKFVEYSGSRSFLDVGPKKKVKTVYFFRFFSRKFVEYSGSRSFLDVGPKSFRYEN